MPVVEITQLRLKGVTADEPSLLESLSQVRSKLHTNSRFFGCSEAPSFIYIFGVWSSLDAHLQFLASPARDEVLGPQEALLDFQWTIHVELDTISPLLLDTPFLAIERLDVDAVNVEAYNQAVEDHAQEIQSHGQDPSCVTHAWRCDLANGSHEAVVLTAWTSREFGDTEEGRHIALNSNNNGPFRQIIFHRTWNMEYT